MRADRHRPRRWQQFIDPIDLKAIDSLLKYLISVSRSLTEASGTRDLAFLSDRIADDVRISLEGLMSGHLQVASDAMRDIMETELLIRDFALDPSQIEKWRNASEDVLRKSFRPVHLRQRQAAALGVDIKDVPGATDYSAHSELLHVRQPLLYPRTPESGAMAGHRAINVLDSWPSPSGPPGRQWLRAQGWVLKMLSAERLERIFGCPCGWRGRRGQCVAFRPRHCDIFTAIGAPGARLTAWSWCWRARQRDTVGTAGGRSPGMPSAGRRRAVGLASEGRGEAVRPATARPG
jgi:hypothetical protein